jgi:hypothetical protein
MVGCEHEVQFEVTYTKKKLNEVHQERSANVMTTEKPGSTRSTLQEPPAHGDQTVICGWITGSSEVRTGQGQRFWARIETSGSNKVAESLKGSANTFDTSPVDRLNKRKLEGLHYIDGTRPRFGCHGRPCAAHL